VANFDVLNRLRSRIETLKRERERLEGEMAVHKKRLKELGFNKLSEAQKWLDQAQAEIAEIDAQISNLIAKAEKIIEGKR